MKIDFRNRNSFARRSRRRESGQGMIEYGLVVGLISVWVVILFVSLKPIFTEKFASENIKRYSGEGRSHLAANLGVTITAGVVVVDDGGDPEEL